MAILFPPLLLPAVKGINFKNISPKKASSAYHSVDQWGKSIG
jgi:hypothetical protein